MVDRDTFLFFMAPIWSQNGSEIGRFWPILADFGGVQLCVLLISNVKGRTIFSMMHIEKNFERAFQIDTVEILSTQELDGLADFFFDRFSSDFGCFRPRAPFPEEIGGARRLRSRQSLILEDFETRRRGGSKSYGV